MQWPWYDQLLYSRCGHCSSVVCNEHSVVEHDCKTRSAVNDTVELLEDPQTVSREERLLPLILKSRNNPAE